MNSFERIEIQLRRKGWKRAEMMRRLAINHTNYAKWKNMGYIPDKYFARLAEIFEVNEDYLRGTTDDPAMEKTATSERGEKSSPRNRNSSSHSFLSFDAQNGHQEVLKQQTGLLPSRTSTEIGFSPYPDDEKRNMPENIDLQKLTSRALKVAFAFDTTDQKTQEILMKILEIEE